MDVYIKPNKKVALNQHPIIRVKDLAEVYAPKGLKNQIEQIEVMTVSQPPKSNYLISVIDIIKTIDNAMPGHTINSVGEMDTIIEYSQKTKKTNQLWLWIKVAFVSLLLLAGSATAIMSFHTDSQIPKVFESYYSAFFDKENKNPVIIDLPYSIGLAVGIIVFFNHFMGKKITDDPTPIEVEMSLYETDVSDTMIDLLNSQKTKRQEQNKQGGKNS